MVCLAKGEVAVAGVIGIHEVELQPRALVGDLEHFIAEEFVPAAQRVPGVAHR